MKVMFIATVAHLQFDFRKKHLFDGKTGILPFIYQEAAKWNSKNRAKGIIETKAITSVTKHIIQQMLLDKVILAFKSKCPSENGTCL